MPVRSPNEFSLTDDKVLLTTVTAIIYFIFLYLLINTAATLESGCFYTFWLPSVDELFSPYWIFVAIVVLLLLWALKGLVWNLVSTTKRNWLNLGYYAIAVFVIGYWLYDLNGFWTTMQYERGEISADEYYGDLLDRVMLQPDEPHRCTLPSNNPLEKDG